MLDNTDAKYAYSSASTSPPSSSSEGDHQGAGGVAGGGAGAVGAATLQQHMMTAGLDGATPHESTSSSGTVYSVEYLSQLLKDKKQLAAFPNVFHHLDRLADEEINRVRSALFQFEFTGKGDDVKLPDAEGEVTITTEKVFVPAKEHPDFNFVGRILGPRGMTAKQLEQETGCKIMVRGRGSMRDKKKEEANRGKPNWEHLSEELHVLIQCEDTPNRTQVKLARAVEEVRKLLVPAPEGEDELKRKQLMELAIINGTYRSASQQAAAAQLAAAAAGKPMAAALQAAAAAAQAQRTAMLGGAGLRASPGLAGAPIIMSPTGRSQAAAQQAALLGLQGGGLAAAQQAALMQQQQAAAEYQQLLMSQGLSYEQLQAVQYQQQQQQQLNLALLQQQQMGGGGMSVASGGYDYSELAAAQQHAAAGAMLANQRRALGGQRDHPYKQ